MILSTDNYQRIYEQLRDEKEAMRYHVEKNLKRVNKMFRAARTTPVWYSQPMTMPKTNNTYLLYYYAMYQHEVLQDAPWRGSPLLVNDENGRRVVIMYRHMSERDTETGREIPYETLQVYSGHFLSRYRERMRLHDRLSANDVVANFFGRNEGYFVQLRYEDFILEANQNKGNRAFGIDDGVTLAEETVLPSGVHVFKHKTFLSRNELKSSQAALLPSRDTMRLTCLM